MMKKIVFTLILVFALAQTFAQGNESVLIGRQGNGDPNATLDIDSKGGKTGFMPPKFTQAQMTALQPTLTVTNKGLTVFNTDENCLQTWKGTVWSECDAISLAKFTFDCSASATKGSYYAGVPVGINNYIELTATVVKPGTFTFYTETINGVRFSYTGIVADIPAGPIKIQIPASGTPTSVNSGVPYKVFDQSGKEICTVSNFTIPVTENNADFTISCTDTKAVGTFTEDQPVNLTDGLGLQLDVSSSGYYSLHTDVIGAAGADTGMWFEGTGYVSASSAARITLTAKGTPKWGTDGNLTFTLYDSKNAAVGCTFTISLQSVKGGYTPDCTVTGTVVNGVFVETKPASASNYITLTVNATKPGPWKITTDVIKGVSFSGVGTFDAVGSKELTLVSNGVADAGSAGSYTFKLLDAANKNALLCTPASKIEIQPSQATMACTGPYAMINSAMIVYKAVTGSAQTISMPIDFTSIGPYNISAIAAGVTLKASGTISTVGSANVTFTVTGTPTTADDIDGVPFILTDALGGSCSRNISIFPTLGSIKTKPAITCKDAMDANGGLGKAPEGEYWIKPTLYTGTAFKTLCDMRNGGLTMVWSYSEQTARNLYMVANSGIPADYSFDKNAPQNDNNFNTEVINYTNFRVSKNAMAAIQVANGTIPGLTSALTTLDNKWRIRVVSSLANAAKLDDANSLDNYIEYTPYTGYGFSSSAGETGGNHFYTGKLTGKQISFSGVGPRYNGVNSYTRFEGAPAREQIYGYPGSPSGQPNYFGGFNGLTKSGHFMDCKDSQSTCQPADLIVSPNNKVIQVFVF